jgi:hypothetical protein
MPEFEGYGNFRKEFHEVDKPTPVVAEICCELEEQRASLLSQHCCCCYEVAGFLFDGLKTLDVGDYSRRFDGKEKIIGHLLEPALQECGIGHTVEGVVYFDSIQPFRIVGEHRRGTDIGRVKIPFPLLVCESTCTCNEFHSRMAASGPDA